MTAPTLTHAAAAELLEQSDDYRVLRRFVPGECYHVDHPHEVAMLHGLYVDTETSGLAETDKIIEFAGVQFLFDAEGRVYFTQAEFSACEDPGHPLSPEITELTGITDEELLGARIEDESVRALFQDVSLVIAHNADFDRPRIEKRFPWLPKLPWACSYREVPWPKFGCVGAKLPHILADACGCFYDAHRALDDCYAGIHALAVAKLNGRPAMSFLLESARSSTARLWAIGSPYSCKDVLKARGYRWSDGLKGWPKAWYRDVPKDAAAEERQWLAAKAGVLHPRVDVLTARERYAARMP